MAKNELQLQRYRLARVHLWYRPYQATPFCYVFHHFRLAAESPSQPRWLNYLFYGYGRAELGAWARRLHYFRFVAALGGHANDGDLLLAALHYRRQVADFVKGSLFVRFGAANTTNKAAGNDAQEPAYLVARPGYQWPAQRCMCYRFGLVCHSLQLQQQSLATKPSIANCRYL